MRTIKVVLLFLLVVFYLFMGAMHFIRPEQYLAMMPSWLPEHQMLILLSGMVEIALAILLIPTKTRPFSARLLVAMLVVFLVVIHIPQTIDFYQTGNEQFVPSILRLPIQILFIAWAWVFAKKQTAGTSN